MTWNELVGPRPLGWDGPSRGLLVGIWGNVLFAVGGMLALPFDHRRILGLNPWIKPMKFDLSIIIFLVTVAFLLAALGRTGAWPRGRRMIAWGLGISLLLENALINMQSLRGVRSHMNYATAFDALSFAAMGNLITIATLLIAALLILYLMTPAGLPASFRWGVCLGLLAMLAGSAEGVLMIVRYGGHTIGAADGGAGLPFVNWSTAHGDLRVAHFFAMHALQVLTLAGWLLSRTGLRPMLQTGLTIGVAVVYMVGTGLLFRQALLGRALLG